MLGSSSRFAGDRGLSGLVNKPRLSRSSSSLAQHSTSSKDAAADAREKYRRKVTSSFAESLDMDHRTTMPPEGTNFTFTDLFLQDHSKLAISADAYTRPFIPLPPGVSPGLMQLHREEAKHVSVASAEKKKKAMLEHRLEEYFKPHASWPHFPKLEARRNRMKAFADQFHGGDFDSAIIRHCGEMLRCSAYVVVCVDKVGVRSSPSYDEAAQSGEVLHPGQLVLIDSILNYSGIKFLKLSTGGWVFNRKANIRIMSYVSNIEIGMWWYRVVSQEFAEIREAPSESERVRSGFVLVPGEVCVVCLRCLVEGKSWMHLADGRGWIFEMKPDNAPTLSGKTDDGVREIVMAECRVEDSGDVLEEEHGAKAMNAAEVGMWEYEVMENVLAVGASVSGWMLRRGDKVFVDMRVPANGQKEVKNATNNPSTRIWLRLNDGRGWVPKTDLSGTQLVRFRKMASGTDSTHYKRTSSNQSADSDQDSWKTGIA